MTDKPQPWPYHAREARDRAAELAVHAIRQLEPIVNNTHPIKDIDQLRGVSVALRDLLQIVRLLESVGACTRP